MRYGYWDRAGSILAEVNEVLVLVDDYAMSLILGNAEQKDYHVSDRVLDICEEDVAYFFDALCGEVVYNRDVRILRMEDYWLAWLDNLRFPNRYGILCWAYAYGLELYRYEGMLYRGLYKRSDVELFSGYYTSFTSAEEMAVRFSLGMFELKDASRHSYVYVVDGIALDVSSMFIDLLELTYNRDLIEKINERYGEYEKIAYFVGDEEDIFDDLAERYEWLIDTRN